MTSVINHFHSIWFQGGFGKVHAAYFKENSPFAIAGKIKAEGQEVRTIALRPTCLFSSPPSSTLRSPFYGSP
jgi:hypothetical protein